MSAARIGKNLTRRTLVGKDRERKKRRSSATQEEAAPPPPPPPLVQRVFLYIQLNEIQSLPETPNEYEIHLYHSKKTLQKMSEHYTTETIIYQKEFNLKKPTFTLTVIQDDIEDMNVFSDNPLIITLFERVPRQPRKSAQAKKAAAAQAIGKIIDMTTEFVAAFDDGEGEGEGEEGLFDESYLKFVSRGYCDLLQVFDHKRFMSNVSVFLYPDIDIHRNEPTHATLTMWHMYTILPILKADTFTNLAFITLESLYNLNTDLIPNAVDLSVRLSFRSTNPNEAGEHHVVPLCHFYGMYYINISEQHTCIAWENMKRDLDLRHRRNIGQTQSTATIKLPNLFYKLLYTEGIDFHTKEIDPVEDNAIVNNSMHRFVLNEEMCAVFADIVTQNSYQLLVEVFRQEFPETILYDGLINLSVFAYPNVNQMRFACALRQVVQAENAGRASIAKNLTPFAVIQICFFNVLTAKNVPLDSYNQSQNKKQKLLSCHKALTLSKKEDDPDMIKELYRLFDELTSAIMLNIIKYKVKSVDDRREYFCCQLANLHNILMKLCGCDFNVRMPTTNNIEFREMITHMFKELLDRAYDIIMSCGRLCLYHCHYNFDKDRQRSIELFNYYKMLALLGDDVLKAQIYDQLKYGTQNTVEFKFFTFLHDIESGNLSAAVDYFKCRVSNRDWAGEYFVALCKIYIKYMLALPNPRLTDTAFERLLRRLRDFTSENLLDSDGHILLYCYYKQCGYLPGMEYTRWRFENLYDVPTKHLNFTPIPIYDFYLTIDPELVKQRSQKFYEAYKLFVRMGLYSFAEEILKEIQEECGAVEKYLMKTVLKLLQKQVDDRFVVADMQTDKSERGRLLYYYLAHVNGNVEYEREAYDKAQVRFAKLLYMEEQYEEWLPLFRLSFLRLGKLAFEAGNYELAELAYRRCQPADDASISFLGNYGLGKSLYYMGRLDEAIPEFAKCTNVEMHAPNVWGYLATIHLRLKQNRQALECWKMAKLYPEIAISDDVYGELAKINPSNCDLLVE